MKVFLIHYEVCMLLMWIFFGGFSFHEGAFVKMVEGKM